MIWPLPTCVGFVASQVSYAGTTFPRIPFTAYPRCARGHREGLWEIWKEEAEGQSYSFTLEVQGSRQ